MEQDLIVRCISDNRIKGDVAAVFGEMDASGITVQIVSEIFNHPDYQVVLYNGNRFEKVDVEKKFSECENNTEFTIAFDKLAQADWTDGDWCLCIGTDTLSEIYFLRNKRLVVQNSCNTEFFDRRSLFGEPVFVEPLARYFVPYYFINGNLAVELCGKTQLYRKQIRNEIVRKLEDGEGGSVWYLKCHMVEGSYIGVLPMREDGDFNSVSECLFYDSYEEKDGYVYMRVYVPCEKQELPFGVLWRFHGENYAAPVAESDYIELISIDVDVEKQRARIVVHLADDQKLESEKAWLIPTELNKQPAAFSVLDAVKKPNGKEKDRLSFILDIKHMPLGRGTWELWIPFRKGDRQMMLPVGYRTGIAWLNAQLAGRKYVGEHARVQIAYEISGHHLCLKKTYGQRALKSNNRQDCSRFLNGRNFITLNEFLNEDVGPIGRMHAEFVKDTDGTVWVLPEEEMGNVLEAALVMFHTMGLGIVSVQPLPIVDGCVESFQIQAPDVLALGKIVKPFNTIWFRMALALRTPDGIYLLQLKNFDLEIKEKDSVVYDARYLYGEPVGKQIICGAEMFAVPYYAGSQLLSLKYVRLNELYRSQFTNELLDVTIKNDILTVKMRCRDCGGAYLGVLLEYRKEKEDDAEIYLIPYDSLMPDGDWQIMVTRIDLKKYYLRMLYWDIRCAFEKDGVTYQVSCHSNNKRFLKKYDGVFVDRAYPSDTSILFPYATDNASVALMHRDACPQDHWKFRLKERVALGIYHVFKPFFDRKNIYLIFEKYCIMAQDNGYYFFKYCMDAEVEKNFDGELYYVLDPAADDWEKILPYRSHVLKYLSLKHMIYLLACRLMISTDTKGHAYVWRSMGSEIKKATYNKNLVFLQHGVTAFKRGHFEKGGHVGCECFITTSRHEHDIIRRYLGYTDSEIPITGFARWDVLHDKSEGHREILMMPTWRTWLDDAENEIFAESDYCKNYMALLNDPRLDAILNDYNVTLNFYLHPKFRKFISEFSVISEKIRLIPFGEEPLNELMMECNLLITDFSSVAWDVYYMKKPVLFYHFDLDDANKTLGFYMDMKNDLFGDRAETPEELMALITEYIENGFQMKPEYLKEHERYFAYVDDDNSKRIWREIRNRHW